MHATAPAHTQAALASHYRKPDGGVDAKREQESLHDAGRKGQGGCTARAARDEHRCFSKLVFLLKTR